jgi:DNA-binding NarL/FixJ family response regulator
VSGVLVGEFGAVMRLGLLEVLADAHIETVGEPSEPPDLLERLEATTPDAVVVDWDDRRSEAVMASVLTRLPTVTVIACSSNRLAMRVVPGKAGAAAYESELSTSGLVEAVRAASAR